MSRRKYNIDSWINPVKKSAANFSILHYPSLASPGAFTFITITNMKECQWNSHFPPKPKVLSKKNVRKRSAEPWWSSHYRDQILWQVGPQKLGILEEFVWGLNKSNCGGPMGEIPLYYIALILPVVKKTQNLFVMGGAAQAGQGIVWIRGARWASEHLREMRNTRVTRPTTLKFKTL